MGIRCDVGAMARLAKMHVKRGASMLDAELPGWRKEIDPRILDIQDGGRCVLGQLFGSYLKGIEALGLDRNGAWRHGFFVPPGGGGRQRRFYRILTIAWKAQLAATYRRGVFL